MPQFGASLTDDSRGIMNDLNVFMIKATVLTMFKHNTENWCSVKCHIGRVVTAQTHFAFDFKFSRDF